MTSSQIDSTTMHQKPSSETVYSRSIPMKTFSTSYTSSAVNDFASSTAPVTRRYFVPFRAQSTAAKTLHPSFERVQSHPVATKTLPTRAVSMVVSSPYISSALTTRHPVQLTAFGKRITSVGTQEDDKKVETQYIDTKQKPQPIQSLGSLARFKQDTVTGSHRVPLGMQTARPFGSDVNSSIQTRKTSLSTAMPTYISSSTQDDGKTSHVSTSVLFQPSVLHQTDTVPSSKTYVKTLKTLKTVGTDKIVDLQKIASGTISTKTVEKSHYSQMDKLGNEKTGIDTTKTDKILSTPLLTESTKVSTVPTTTTTQPFSQYVTSTKPPSVVVSCRDNFPSTQSLTYSKYDVSNPSQRLGQYYQTSVKTKYHDDTAHKLFQIKPQYIDTKMLSTPIYSYYSQQQLKDRNIIDSQIKQTTYEGAAPIQTFITTHDSGEHVIIYIKLDELQTIIESLKKFEQQMGDAKKILDCITDFENKRKLSESQTIDIQQLQLLLSSCSSDEQLNMPLLTQQIHGVLLQFITKATEVQQYFPSRQVDDTNKYHSIKTSTTTIPASYSKTITVPTVSQNTIIGAPKTTSSTQTKVTNDTDNKTQVDVIGTETNSTKPTQTVDKFNISALIDDVSKKYPMKSIFTKFTDDKSKHIITTKTESKLKQKTKDNMESSLFTSTDIKKLDEITSKQNSQRIKSQPTSQQEYLYSLQIETSCDGKTDVRCVDVIKIHQSPGILFMTEFLTRHECEDTIKSKHQFQGAHSGDVDMEESMLDTVTKRLEAIFKIEQTDIKSINIIECDPDKPPTTQQLPPGSTHFLILLNDVAQGGTLDFKSLGVHITPHCGTAIVWMNSSKDYKILESTILPSNCKAYYIIAELGNFTMDHMSLVQTTSTNTCIDEFKVAARKSQKLPKTMRKKKVFEEGIPSKLETVQESSVEDAKVLF